MSLSLADPVDDAPGAEQFSLAKPIEVKVVDDDQAIDLLPKLEEADKDNATAIAKSFTTEISRITPKSVEFDNKVNDILTLASDEIVKSAEGPNRMLSRSSTSVAGSRSSSGDIQIKVAGTLAELRSTVDDLNPNQSGLTKKFLGVFPMGKKVTKYFQKYESAESQLNGIIKALMDGQDALRQDNSALGFEKDNQMKLAYKLNEYAYLAKSLDASLTNEINQLKAQGNLERANALENDVLFYVRQRSVDIHTQIAVSVQAILAMDLIRRNNIELIKGVDRARTTTVSALRTAIMVAEALNNQKLVLDQIDAVNQTTNNIILQTSQQLRQQTARIHEQAASSGVKPEVLEEAFNNIYATMDEIDTFKQKANESMSQTVAALEGQITRSKPYLERAQRNQALEESRAKGQIGA
jgi:uncharacterized protein YaaN involved in tellurite resistance